MERDGQNEQQNGQEKRQEYEWSPLPDSIRDFIFQTIYPEGVGSFIGIVGASMESVMFRETPESWELAMKLPVVKSDYADPRLLPRKQSLWSVVNSKWGTLAYNKISLISTKVADGVSYFLARSTAASLWEKPRVYLQEIGFFTGVLIKNKIGNARGIGATVYPLSSRPILSGTPSDDVREDATSYLVDLRNNDPKRIPYRMKTLVLLIKVQKKQSGVPITNEPVRNPQWLGYPAGVPVQQNI